MRGSIWGALGLCMALMACSPDKGEQGTAPNAGAKRQYTASAALDGDYVCSEALLMQDWRFSHIQLRAPNGDAQGAETPPASRFPAAFVFEQTKAIQNAKGERQKLIVLANDYRVSDERVMLSGAASAGGALGFDGRVEDGKLVGTLVISPNDPVEATLQKP